MIGAIRVISDPTTFLHVSHADREQYFNMKATTQQDLLAEFAIPPVPDYQPPPVPSTPRIRRKAVQTPVERTVKSQPSFEAASARSSEVPSLMSTSARSSCRSVASGVVNESSSDDSPQSLEFYAQLARQRSYSQTSSTGYAEAFPAAAPRQTFSHGSISIAPSTPIMYQNVYELDAVETSPPPPNHLQATFAFELAGSTLQDALPQDLLVEPGSDRRSSKLSNRSSRSCRTRGLDYRSAGRGAAAYAHRPLPPLPLMATRKTIVRSPTSPTRRKPAQDERPSDEPPLMTIMAKYQHSRKRSRSNPDLPMPRFSLSPTLPLRLSTGARGCPKTDEGHTASPSPLTMHQTSAPPARDGPEAPLVFGPPL